MEGREDSLSQRLDVGGLERERAAPEASEPAPAEISLEKRFFNWRTYASFAVAIGIIVLALTRFNIDVGETARVLQRTQMPFYLAALLVYYATFPVRAVRWRQMLWSVGYRLIKLPGIGGLAEIIFLSWFANCLVPAKLGDLYRAYLLKKNSPVSFSRVTGTVLGERVVDFAVLLAMMVLAGAFAFHGRFTSDVSTALIAGVGFVALMVTALLVMYQFGSHVERVLPQRVRPMYSRFSEGTLGSFRQLPIVAVLSGGAWLLEAGRLFLVTRSLGITLSPDPFIELAMIVFVGLGSALLTVPPGTPAGLGYAEAGITAVLISFKLPPAEAVSITVLDRSLSYGSVVIFGAIVYLISKRK
ncbi:MAG: flippase-like domain-containing protein [Bacteroidetes bacterium]|nr:flippase-like domain-containing protein [Bacteroidota bacterium]MCL5026292.1 flippase-like domain-containing protein [Chloroflexota bacterium]